MSSVLLPKRSCGGLHKVDHPELSPEDSKYRIPSS